ncbi:MAG: response regulator [Gammaproteobacteria bacterium]|nr:response regulator [Gammaproteobacteria bacterium]
MSTQPNGLAGLGALLPDGLLLLSPDGQVLDANPAALKLLGTSLSEIREQGLPCSDHASLKRYLGLCASASDLLPGSLDLLINDQPQAFRADTGLFSPPTDPRDARLLMRLVSHASATQRFHLLTERVEQLGRQVDLRMRAEQLLDAQRAILEQIVSEQPLQATLDELTHFIDRFSRDGAIASILLYDVSSNRLRHGSAPKLPQMYCEAIDGLEAGPTVGSCGAAAFLNETIVAADLQTHPNWSKYRDLAAAANLQSCFSIPITGNQDQVLGTFAVYYREAREPSAEDVRVALLLTRTAALAIERDRNAAERQVSLTRERALRGEAEEANRSKDEFLAMVSHELRNPLNAILGWAKVLTMDNGAETLAKGLGAIERNATLQAQLIEEILDYSRITAGKMQLDIAPHDFRATLTQALDSARPAADSKNIEFVTRLEALSDTPIAFDSGRLLQVFNNLLSNAIKFTPQSGRIEVEARESDAHVHVRVRDNGCGIEPHFLPHIFERFQQQDRSQHRENEGLGLGLAISSHIMTLHHGEITAHSDGRGRGASFEIRLPRRFTWSHKKEATVVATPDLDGLRLLAVDDAPDTRGLLQTIFSTVGAEVEVAANGKDAIERLRDWQPDILLCDIGMPGLDGYDVVRQLREDERGNSEHRTTAIALTAYARSRDRQRALDAGFDAHMAKPIDPAQLLQVVAGFNPQNRTK